MKVNTTNCPDICNVVIDRKATDTNYFIPGTRSWRVAISDFFGLLNAPERM
jgi:hypothetical protein